MQDNHRSGTMLAIVVACGAFGCIPPDEIPVTGDPSQSNTQVFEQGEAVVTVSAGLLANDIIAVAYNDRTVDPNKLLTDYPAGLDGDQRIIRRGESLMGWSISEDDGMSFTYQGKVYPPADWSLIWSDPAIATGGPLHTTVYMAQPAGSDVSFPPGGALMGPVTASNLDGFCVAESLDSGRSFPNVRCFMHGACSIGGKSCSVVSSEVCSPLDPCCEAGQGVCDGGFYDGAVLAADRTHVYFASFFFPNATPEVWRAPIPGLNFVRLADVPFDPTPMVEHPRLRFGPNGRLYILSFNSQGHVMASFLEPGGSTWSEPRKVTDPGVVLDEGSMVLSDRIIRLTTQFSFDFARNPDTQQDELRVAVAMMDGGKHFIQIYICPADLPPHPMFPGFANCQAPPGLSTRNTLGDQYSPNISVAGTLPRWMVTFLSRQSDPNGNHVEVRRGGFAMLLGQPILPHFRLVAPQVPCSELNGPLGEYWGDYNDLTHFIAPEDVNSPTPRFVAPFTRNGQDPMAPTDCAFRGTFMADFNVGAVVFR